MEIHTMKFKFNKLFVGGTFMFISLHASASLFGPDNFEECVLEKMKGQNSNLLKTAKDACRKAFPREIYLKEGVNYTKGEFEASWCNTTNNTITICIDKNNTNYKITSVGVMLSMKTCEETTQTDWISFADVNAPYYGNKFKVSVRNAREMKCMRKSFSGKLYLD